MRLTSIMSTSVEVIGPRASVTTAELRLRRKDIHHLVVVDHGTIVGLVTRDSLRNRTSEGATRVEDAMLRNIRLATPDTTVREAVALMTSGHEQTALPVVRNGRLVGIVTVSDLLELATGAPLRARPFHASRRGSPRPV